MLLDPCYWGKPSGTGLGEPMTLGTDSVRLWEPLKLEEVVTMVIRLGGGEPLVLRPESVRLWEPMGLGKPL